MYGALRSMQLDINFTSLEAVGSVRKASKTNSGPRNEPPMPIARTEVSFLPVQPSHWVGVRCVFVILLQLM
jgi:hypothetical protein